MMIRIILMSGMILLSNYVHAQLINSRVVKDGEEIFYPGEAIETNEEIASGNVRIESSGAIVFLPGFKKSKHASLYATVTDDLDQILDRNDISIYPNPVKESFRLEVAKAMETEVSIKIYDILGKVVSYGTDNLTLSKREINYAIDKSLVNGIYAVHFNLNDQTIVKKIIIEK